MKALVFERGRLCVLDLEAPQAAELGPKQVLCRTKSVQFAPVDRAVLSGALDQGVFAAPPIPGGGLVVGRLALAEVVACGAEVKDVAVGDRVAPAYQRPLTGHGFARELFVCAADEVVVQSPLGDGYQGPDPFRFGGMLPMAERLFEGHMLGTKLISERFGLVPTPGAPMLFHAGGGRRGEDVVRPTSLSRWMLQNALIVGHGPEALYLAGLLGTFTTGSGSSKKPLKVTVVSDMPDDDVRALLEAAGISVIMGKKPLVDLLPKGTFGAVHLVNTTDAVLAAALWGMLEEYAFMALDSNSAGGASTGFEAYAADKTKVFVEALATGPKLRGKGPAMLTVVDQGQAGWMDKLPVAAFAFSGIDCGEVENAIRSQPWARVCVRF